MWDGEGIRKQEMLQKQEQKIPTTEKLEAVIGQGKFPATSLLSAILTLNRSDNPLGASPEFPFLFLLL